MNGHHPFFQPSLFTPIISSLHLTTKLPPPIFHVITSMTSTTTTNNKNHSGGRDDCWTESETEVLIESWGDRYLQLNRGNLRQNDWKDVADAVNSHRDRLKPPRTDVQCKNRIDTLKKKYKVEKSKTTPSKWPFFHRLDDLIGAAGTSSVTRKKVNVLSKPVSVKVTVKSGLKPKPIPIENPSLNLRGGVYSGGSETESVGRMEGGEGMMAYKELARVIVRFGEVYEKTESRKQEEMMKLEKERMEFTREIEFQRLNMFMETQVEIEKMKRKKDKDNNKKKKKRSSVDDDSSSPGKKPQR